MKIYTKVEYMWNDKLGKLVQLSADSFEQSDDAPLDLCKYGYSESHQGTWIDTTTGYRYTVVRRRWRTNKRTGRAKWRDFAMRTYDKDGNLLSEELGLSNTDQGLDSVRAKAGAENIVSESDYVAKVKADKETARIERKAEEATAEAKSTVEDVTALETEKAQKMTARVSGEAIRTQKDALLAQGYNPEEAEMMTAQGSENIARSVADLGAQGLQTKAQTMQGLAQFGAEQQWTAESLSQNLRQMQQNLMQHREQLANNLEIANIEASAAGGAADAEAAGQVAMAIGTAAAGSDIGLKMDIELIGQSESGTNIYEFNYIDESYGLGRYRGVLAQEVPYAAFEGEDGYLWVDYSKVDVPFEQVS